MTQRASYIQQAEDYQTPLLTILEPRDNPIRVKGQNCKHCSYGAERVSERFMFIYVVAHACRCLFFQAGVVQFIVCMFKMQIQVTIVQNQQYPEEKWSKLYWLVPGGMAKGQWLQIYRR